MLWAKKQSAFTIVELLIVVVVIAILAAITVVAYNGVTDKAKASAKASDIASMKKQSEVYKVENNIECPPNYVFVYGNSALGTTDFCVMKYEAKITGNDVGTTSYVGSMTAESRASGTPWVSISQTQAIAESIEAGGHLLTEAEWMTLAADVLSVKYNWSGQEVGSGHVYQGHINSNPANGIAASTDDTDTLNGMTGGKGTTVGTNSSRVFYLKSGDAIWDLSGNVWEWTQQAIGTPTLSVSNIGVSGDTPGTWTWREYTLGSLSFGNMPAISRPSVLNSVAGLTSLTWSTDTGVGQLYASYPDTAPRAFFRGGRWTNNIYAGILALGLSDVSSTGTINTGFRVAK